MGFFSNREMAPTKAELRSLLPGAATNKSYLHGILTLIEHDLKIGIA